MAKINLDMADVRPSVASFMVVGLMSVVFIVMAKYLVTRYPVPGLTEVIKSV